MRGKVQTATFGARRVRRVHPAVRLDLGSTSRYSTPTSGRSGQAVPPGGNFTLATRPRSCAARPRNDFPVYEIHISNPASRGGQSQVAGVCRGVITLRTSRYATSTSGSAPLIWASTSRYSTPTSRAKWSTSFQATIDSFHYLTPAVVFSTQQTGPV